MKPFHTILLSVSLLFLLSQNTFAGGDPVGIVKAVEGDVQITSEQTSIRAVPNMRIIQGDSIQTGPNSSAGLIFKDDTVVGLGPDSELHVENFLFDPANRKLSFVARMVRGTFSFITGQIARLAPQKVILETPDATLGVRGTKFLVKID